MMSSGVNITNSQTVRVAVAQMTSKDSVAENLLVVEQMIRAAAQQQVRLLLLPENFALFSAKHYFDFAACEEQAPSLLPQLQALAAELRIWIGAGTMPMRAPNDEGRVRAASLLINAAGEIVARYDKIHLFDAEVSDQQGGYSESHYMAPGEEPVIADTPFGRIGLSVCYDLRFPELYRYYAKQDVAIVLVPSAFTAVTGAAHWEVLLQARAIENQLFVLGANQTGFHTPTRQTWGHSMIVDPWGERLATIESDIGIAVAELDFARRSALQQKMPVLSHCRL